MQNICTIWKIGMLVNNVLKMLLMCQILYDWMLNQNVNNSLRN